MKAAIRRWFWRYVMRYAYETCADCGRRVAIAVKGGEPLTYWLTTDDLWALVRGTSQDVVCPRCFVEQATAREVRVVARLMADAKEVP